MLARGPLTYLVHGQWEYSLWPTEFVGAPEHPEAYASMKEWSNRLDLANDTTMYTDEKGNSCTGPASPIYIKHYPCLSFEEFMVTTGRGTNKLTSNRDVSPWALDPRGSWSAFNFVNSSCSTLSNAWMADMARRVHDYRRVAQVRFSVCNHNYNYPRGED
jgi:hypothetical protein